ncbi:MAG: hypothetical protein GVY02_00570 [Bacteroidetes bacterium]|jgi:hypothetical protein|nr:hypothetical protein [Bacteroidota bacterium]
MNRIWFAFAPIFISLVLLSSCREFFGLDKSESENKMTLEEVARAIDSEIGNADATSLSQCKAIPIGDKPCGGPWGYLVYSTQESNEATLQSLIEKYNELDRVRNEEEERMSTCDVATEPELTLRDGACRGVGAYAWNPGDILKFNRIDP